MVNLKAILMSAVKVKASDIHLMPGISPYLRVRGELKRLDSPPLTHEDMEQILEITMPTDHAHPLHEERGVDFSYQLEDKARFRCVVYYQDNDLCLALRWIPFDIPSIEDLEFPPVIKDIAQYQRGLVLVTGITGCGKSTTLAAMLNHLNKSEARRIITIEDPIEYKFPNIKSIISQREVGRDVPDFRIGLRQSLRADPDVIMIGEMRDVETIKVAIKAAETGHLVLSTLHTTTALGTVQRIIGHFPREEHDLVREQLSYNLRATITQRLLATLDGKFRIAAMEILVVNQVVAKLIHDNRVADILSIMRSRQSGMQCMDQGLADLVVSKQVSLDQALKYCNDPYALKRFMAGVASSGDKGAIVAAVGEGY